MRSDLHTYLLDLAYQDWARWRTEYFYENTLSTNISSASLRRLEVLLANMDRTMRDFMLVVEQHGDRGTDTHEAPATLHEAVLRLVAGS